MSFLEKFSDKASDYDDVKKLPKLTDVELRDQLETAIADCPELLKALTSVGMIERAQVGTGVATALTYPKFYEILMETAVLADQSWKTHHPVTPREPQQPQPRLCKVNRNRFDRQHRMNNSVVTGTLTSTEAAKLADMKKKYGTKEARFSIPNEIYTVLPVPVQTAFKEWRKVEQKKHRETRAPGGRLQAANLQQQAPASDMSTIASQGDWVVIRCDVYQASQLPPIPEVVDVIIPQNTAPAQAPSAAGSIL